METKYLLAGDKAIVVEFGDIIDEDINRKVINLMKNIESSSLINSIYEMIPTYRSLMIIYNPLKITFNDLINSVKNIECNLKVLDKREKNIKIKIIFS